MSVIEQLADRRKEKLKSASQQYRAVLGRTQDGTNVTKDVELLDGCVSLLGIQPDQIEHDLDVLRQLRQLQPVADDAAARMATLRASKTSHAEYLSRRESEIRRLDQEASVHESKLHQDQAMVSESYQAQRDIEDIRRKHTHLF